MDSDSSFVIGAGELLWDLLPEEKRCGGAPANVVYHLNRLGIPAFIVSAVGQDAAGDELIGFLNAKQIPTDFITRNALPTGRVSVSLHDGVPAYVIHQPAAWDAIAIPDALRQKLPRAAAVIWGTLAQRSAVSRQAIREILKSVPETCLKCFDVNLRQNFFDAAVIDESLRCADVLKINDEEVGATAGLLHLTGSLQEVLPQLLQRYRLRGIICTLGADGSLFYDGKTFTRYPVKPCRVVDTVGCGDAFLAAWCAALLHGETAEAAMLAGTELSAQVAACAGAMPE